MKPAGNPWYPLTRWVWVWAKSQIRHGYGFFNGHRYFSRVRVWDDKPQRVCTRCHLYFQPTEAPTPSSRARRPGKIDYLGFVRLYRVRGVEGIKFFPI
jgi:hypothetical protein